MRKQEKQTFTRLMLGVSHSGVCRSLSTVQSATYKARQALLVRRRLFSSSSRYVLQLVSPLSRVYFISRSLYRLPMMNKLFSSASERERNLLVDNLYTKNSHSEPLILSCCLFHLTNLLLVDLHLLDFVIDERTCNSISLSQG